MAGNSGSIQEAATVGGYELGVGSKPRELLCVLNGYLPVTNTGGYISPSGAICAGAAALRFTTNGDHDDTTADNSLVVTTPTTSTLSIDGETLTHVAPVCATLVATGSSGADGIVTTAAFTGTVPAGNLIVHTGKAAQSTSFTVDLHETDAAGTILPLISACSFGAGSLIMGVAADRIEGAFVFGSGQDGGDLNILDATIQMTVDLGGNATSTANEFSDITPGNMGHDFDAGATPMNCAVTAVSGGTVHFVADCENGTPALSDYYRLSIRALAHPKGGI